MKFLRIFKFMVYLIINNEKKYTINLKDGYGKEACSSGVEHCFDVARVSGSNPLMPTTSMVNVYSFVI